MGIQIEPFDLGDGDLEAYYLHEPISGISGMAIQPDLPQESYLARELEGLGYEIRPPRNNRKACYAARSLEDIDQITVRSIRRRVEELAPLEVEAVKDALRMSGDPRWIAAYCHIDIHIVQAIIGNLKQRGFEPGA